MKHNRTSYVRGCRCDICRKANRIYQLAYLQKRIKAGITDNSGRKIRRG